MFAGKALNISKEPIGMCKGVFKSFNWTATSILAAALDEATPAACVVSCGVFQVRHNLHRFLVFFAPNPFDASTLLAGGSRELELFQPDPARHPVKLFELSLKS